MRRISKWLSSGEDSNKSKFSWIGPTMKEALVVGGPSAVPFTLLMISLFVMQTGGCIKDNCDLSFQLIGVGFIGTCLLVATSGTLRTVLLAIEKIKGPNEEKGNNGASTERKPPENGPPEEGEEKIKPKREISWSGDLDYKLLKINTMFQFEKLKEYLKKQEIIQRPDIKEWIGIIESLERDGDYEEIQAILGILKENLRSQIGRHEDFLYYTIQDLIEMYQELFHMEKWLKYYQILQNDWEF